MLIEQQIAERQARAGSAVVRVLERPAGSVYGDYRIKSGSGRSYRVAVRGPRLFENYCSCPDFAVNTLGTCKHIEALLSRLRQRHRKALETAGALAAEYFDPAGLLGTGRSRVGRPCSRAGGAS